MGGTGILARVSRGLALLFSLPLRALAQLASPATQGRGDRGSEGRTVLRVSTGELPHPRHSTIDKCYLSFYTACSLAGGVE
jgi:hypothetical protein